MQRITVSLDDNLVTELDAHMERKGYGNRSEVFRDALRAQFETERLETGEAKHCIACLSYVYDHQERDLTQRLVRAQHHHHDVSLSTLHIHLDHDNCMEVAILRGATAEIRALANAILAQRGVRHGHLRLVSAEVALERHGHGKGSKQALHVHSRPKT
jgi:CopG family transcriptional regulator, nickel-responsive regulator